MKQNLSSWDLVHVFLSVMRHGSLSAAARALNLSQPTVRRQIESLEAELGTPLFSRSLTGLVPTDVGAALLAQAETAEAAMKAFQRNASDPAKADQGIVRVTCSEIFGVEILPPIFAALMAQHPLLVIELVLSNRTDDLLKREADVAVRLTPPRQAALIAKKVAPVEIGLFAAKQFLQANPAPKSLDHLLKTGRFIGDDHRDAIAKGFTASKLQAPEKLVLKTDSDLAQLAAIRSGVGIGVCQVKIADASGLKRVLPGIASHLDCWVVMHEDLKSSKRIRLVFDHLVLHLSKWIRS